MTLISDMLDDLLHGDWAERLLVGSILILLAACLSVIGVLVFDSAKQWQEGELHSGIVLAHRFEPAHSTTALMPVGKMFVPMTTFHPDHYELLLEGATNKGNHVKRWVGVTKQTYERMQDGQVCTFSEEKK